MKELQRLIRTGWALLKVKAVKKGAQLLSDIAAGLIVLLLLLMILFFLGIALALFFSSLFDSYLLGFFVTGCICLILLVLFQVFKPQIKSGFRSLFTRILTHDDDEKV